MRLSGKFPFFHFNEPPAEPIPWAEVIPSDYTGTSNNYKRFVILTHARSGSSLMVRLLESHTSILCYGELFVKSRVGYNVNGFDNNDQEVLKYRNEMPVHFLKNIVFNTYNDQLAAVGFKLFPDQMSTTTFERAWQWLAEQKDIKIIHLNRSNRLAAFTSLMMAKTTGKFGIKDSSDRNDVTLKLDPDECAAYFQEREDYVQMIRRDFVDHDLLELDYTDMDDHLEDTMNAVQDFLGLKTESLKTDKVKQEVRPLNEVIENFEELKQQFSHTRWADNFKL